MNWLYFWNIFVLDFSKNIPYLDNRYVTAIELYYCSHHLTFRTFSIESNVYTIGRRYVVIYIAFDIELSTILRGEERYCMERNLIFQPAPFLFSLQKFSVHDYVMWDTLMRPCVRRNKQKIQIEMKKKNNLQTDNSVHSSLRTYPQPHQY